MSDMLLASLLVICGMAWTVIRVAALFNDPAPGDVTVLALLAGPAAALAGVVWWIVIVASWVL